MMRRLQSFKTPSRLNEKLRFTNKNTCGTGSAVNNGIKFVPNVNALNSNEAVDNQKTDFNVTLRNVTPTEEFNQEKVEQPKTWNKNNIHLSQAVSRGEATDLSETKYFTSNPSIGISTNTALGSQPAGVCRNTFKLKHDITTNGFEGWSVFQLPKYLPENINDASESGKFSVPTLLQDTPSGSIGKLTFRRNCEMDLSLNSGIDKESISFKVNCISKGNSEQFITAFPGINELINLGKCDSLLIATPKI